MKSTRLPATCLLFSLGLASCTLTTPNAVSIAPLPAAWKNAAAFPVPSADRDLTRWWSRFDDPVLTHIISDGLSNSPDIASASARVRESRARRNETAASLFPSLTGSASSNSSSINTDGSPKVSDTIYSAGLDASWEVDWFGKNRSKVEAASAEMGAATENFHSVQASLASEIALAYTSLRTDETRLAVLCRIVASREQTSQLATWREQSGETDALESSQALSSLEQARAGIPALKQAIAQSKNLLAKLCGRTPGALDATLASGKSAIPTPARSLAVGIPADTIRQRPDVRLAGWQLAAAVAATRSAEAERFPSLRLSGSLGVNALSVSKLFDPRTTTANLIAGLTGPIFDAGRIRSNIEASGAAQDQAVQTYRSAVLTGLSEVEDALIACRRSAERLDILEKASAAARQASDLADQRYQSGVTDLLTVLDTQRVLLNLEDSLLRSRQDHTSAYIQLYKALGGGWTR